MQYDANNSKVIIDQNELHDLLLALTTDMALPVLKEQHKDEPEALAELEDFDCGYDFIVRSTDKRFTQEHEYLWTMRMNNLLAEIRLLDSTIHYDAEYTC